MIILSLIFALDWNSYFLVFLCHFIFFLFFFVFSTSCQNVCIAGNAFSGNPLKRMYCRTCFLGQSVKAMTRHAERGVAYSAVKSMTTRTKVFVSSSKCLQLGLFCFFIIFIGVDSALDGQGIERSLTWMEEDALGCILVLLRWICEST